MSKPSSLLSKSGLEAAPSRRLAIPFHPPTISGLNLVTVPRRLKQRSDEGKEVGKVGLGITLQPNFSPRNSPVSPLARSLKTEEIIRLQITTPGAGLHLIASDLEALRY